jgi:hypothetical protein
MPRSVYVVGPASAAAQELGAAVGALFSSLRDASERRRRMEEHNNLLNDLWDKIAESQDKETANHVLSRFEAADYSPNFDVAAEIQWFQRKRMYEFAINTVDEKFADALIERMQKFAAVEYETTMNEVVERTLAEVGYSGDIAQEAERLVTSFPDFLEVRRKRLQEAKDNATLVREHKIGSSVVLEYSDGRFEFKTIMGEIKVFTSLREARGYLT